MCSVYAIRFDLVIGMVCGYYMEGILFLHELDCGSFLIVGRILL